MQIVESRRIIITAWLKCTLNKVHVHSCRPHHKLSEGREVLQKFTHLEAAFFCQVQTCVNLIIYSCCISGGAALKSHVTVTVAVS